MKKSLVMMSIAVCSFLISEQALGVVDCSEHRGRITVTGHGTVEVDPDEVVLNFNIQETSKNAADVHALVDNKMTKLLDGLKAKGIKAEQIRADNVRITPEYKRDDKGNYTTIGYQASRDISVKLWDFALIADITDLALASGFNGISGFEYKLKDAKTAKTKAQNEAIKDAREQAKLLADGFGVKLSSPCDLHFEDSAYPPLRTGRNMMGVQLNAASAPKETYSQDKLVIESQVSAEYVIE